MKHFIKRPARNSKYFLRYLKQHSGGEISNEDFSVGGWNSCQGLHVLFSTGEGSLPKRAAEGVSWQRDIILWALHCAETVVVTAVVLLCWPRCLFSQTPLVLVVLVVGILQKFPRIQYFIFRCSFFYYPLRWCVNLSLYSCFFFSCAHLIKDALLPPPSHLFINPLFFKINWRFQVHVPLEWHVCDDVLINTAATPPRTAELVQMQIELLLIGQTWWGACNMAAEEEELPRRCLSKPWRRSMAQRNCFELLYFFFFKRTAQDWTQFTWIMEWANQLRNGSY